MDDIETSAKQHCQEILSVLHSSIIDEVDTSLVIESYKQYSKTVDSFRNKCASFLLRLLEKT